MAHELKQLLIDLGLSSKSSVRPFYPRTRDRVDVGVLRCERSGVIILTRTDHMRIQHYNKKDFNGRGAHSRRAALKATAVDSTRRAEQFRSLVKGKRWIDIGAGAGGVLDVLAPHARYAAAVEPQDKSRASLARAGYHVYPLALEVPEKDFDVATLFHVLEHFTDPLGELQRIRKLLKKRGTLVVEVPHARDALITIYESEAFKAHTFWSEHLMLHTRESLVALLKEAGFTAVKVSGFQRYPLANHLHWLAKGKGGGQVIWPKLSSPALDSAYSDALQKADATDTLIAIARA